MHKVDFESIESLVCGCVNEVISKNVTHEATVANLYTGKTKTYLEISIARQFSYYVLHDMYHVAYSAISRRSNNSVRGIMQNTKKVRYLMYNDEVYKSIAALINERLV